MKEWSKSAWRKGSKFQPDSLNVYYRAESKPTLRRGMARRILAKESNQVSLSSSRVMRSMRLGGPSTPHQNS